MQWKMRSENTSAQSWSLLTSTYAVALKALLQSGEYETETREWSKLQETQQTWTKWKTNFREAYVAKRRSEAAREEEEKPFGGSVTFGGTNNKKNKGSTDNSSDDGFAGRIPQ